MKKLTIGKLKAKADRKFQDFYRGGKCEICGQPMFCLHHFIEKSRSNYLRYEIRNMVKVCLSCHYKFHHPDPVNSLNELIKRIRGKAWVGWIESHRILEKRDNRKELERIIKQH